MYFMNDTVISKIRIYALNTRIVWSTRDSLLFNEILYSYYSSAIYMNPHRWTDNEYKDIGKAQLRSQYKMFFINDNKINYLYFISYL